MSALAVHPTEEALLQLKARIESQAAAEKGAAEARAREAAVKDALTRAEAALTRSQFPEALEIVTAALATQPAEDRLLKLKSRIESRAAAEQAGQQRKADLASLKQMADQAKKAADFAVLEELSARALSIVNGHSGDSEVKAAQAKVQSEIKSRTAALTAKAKAVTAAVPVRPAVETPGLAPQPSNLPKYAAMAAGAAVLIFGGVYFLGGKKPVSTGAASVRVQVSPAGATVRAGDQTCQQADCKFALPPGKYEVSANLPGYEPVTQTVTVDAADLNLNFTLAPSPAKLNISTNIEAGTITLD